MNKAIRGSIMLAGIKLEVFHIPQTQSNFYVFSQTQVATAVNVPKMYVTRWLKNKESTVESGFYESQYLDSKRVEALPGNNFTGHKIESNKQGKRGESRIKIVPIELAVEFWLDQALTRNNEQAIALTYACLNEALKRRCDEIFLGKLTTDLIDYESDTEDDKNNFLTYLQSRSILRDSHISFTNCCLYNGFNAAIAHNEITKQLLGKTAKELREDELINGNYRVGLNHIPNSDELILIAKVKLEFSRYRHGNVYERVKRAVNEIMKLK
ncbi:MAG: hypothetical protein EAZ76_01670 [Nostocales cyanobacterium]|nr:MAG: hypothetical protein EAZ87_04925 [Nostocales cyanobacterium]TAF20358.1 MAG: hypothetical protein EAZ76_01670 [Nostocales cyanobacterium]